ncbi:hypothetical protein [Geobacillus sp. C56-T2]|uniref:hypothetical protein n=1 Tax=Geobacillus sp. C56-T2 TaxID=600773 RepID=UPI0011A007BB|nr:hypothetical protein [Geobacillus sp. C56-T2]NNV06835.1 hypothetical protein [Geobacillus sp. MMMUD3]
MKQHSCETLFNLFNSQVERIGPRGEDLSRPSRRGCLEKDSAFFGGLVYGTPRKGDVAVFLGVFCLAEWLLCHCAGMFGLRNGQELAYDEGKMTYHRVGDQAIGE